MSTALTEREFFSLAKQNFTLDLQQELVSRYDKLIWKVVNRAASSFAQATKEVLYSESLIGLFRAFEKYDHVNPKNGAKFATYAYYWIRRQVFRWMEREQKHYHLQLEKPEIEKGVRDMNIGADLIGEEILSLLPELEAEIVYRRIWRGETYPEIAEATDRSRSWVRQKYHEAVDKLKGKLERKEEWKSVSRPATPRETPKKSLAKRLPKTVTISPQMRSLL